MKSIILVLLLVCTFINNAFSQALPITENFSFTGNLTANGWLNYPTAGVNTSFLATGTTTGLTFNSYANSGIDNAAHIIGDGEDVYKPFSPQTSGDVYASAMIKVNSASKVITGTTTGDYFYHFYGKNAGGVSYQYCRFYAKDNGTTNPGFVVAVNKTTLGPIVNGSNVAPLNYSPTVYPYGSTILVVLKYSFISTTNPDDPCSAYVFTASSGIPSTEPAFPTLGPVTAGATAAGDAGQLLGVSLRRADPDMNIVVDGINVANTWAATVALPVILSRFDVSKKGSDALVSWNVELEKDEPKYTIQQSKDGVHFEDIFTQNLDNQNNKYNKKYQYEIKNLTKGVYYFRLKMNDKSGWEELSVVRNIRIEGGNIDVKIKQNELTIRYENERDFLEKSNIFIIDSQGKKIKTLELSEATQTFNLDDLQSGFYFLSSEKENQINGFKFFKP